MSQCPIRIFPSRWDTYPRSSSTRKRVLRVSKGVGKGEDEQSSRKVATDERSAMIRHPSLSLLSGPFSREDLFLAVYCVVDDWMRARFGSANAPRARRGPGEGEFTDAEVLTVLRVGELCHWLRPVRASYQALFPALPTDGQFSRRAQGVREADRPRLAGQLVDLHLGPGQPAA